MAVHGIEIDPTLSNRPLHIAFVLYNDFRANSAIQVHHFANALVERGCRCDVVVPRNPASCHSHIGPPILYSASAYPDYLQGKNTTSGPDIIHAWTPREVVRKQVECMRSKWPDARLIVDLEDNEDLVTSAQLGWSVEKLKAFSESQLDDLVPNSLSHPVKYRRLLDQADGFTVIMDTLSAHLPQGKPWHLLWPILDKDRFFPQEKDPSLMSKLGLKPEELVLSYIGNVHAANWREVRSLYLAVGLARREGIPVKLVRAGRDFYPFWGSGINWTIDGSISLGMVANREIPALLALADLLVQPGKPDPFNDYRLPSKLPEFLGMGKPVALPRTNLGRFLEQDAEAFVMDNGDALEILKHIQGVWSDPQTYSKVGEQGLSFALRHFDREQIAERLVGFYEGVMNEGSFPKFGGQTNRNDFI